jgi:two-component system nitrogen regulation response regulator GlnG/two-component system response regulator HydG
MASDDTTKTILFATLSSTVTSFAGNAFDLPGFRVINALSIAKALAVIEKEKIDVVFLDIEAMPKQEIDLVNYIKSCSPRSEIIILCTIGELEEATKALRNGASFYLVKPVKAADIKTIVGKLGAKVDRQEEYRALEQRILSDLMSGSPAMEKILKLAVKIAPTTSTVLIGGETGTGKEFFARIIHRMSKRTDGEFVAMNCGGVPETLFESELFGYKKGAFTGADRDKTGLVEEAHLGTLFLDEVGELSPSAQVKLLRFLQERTFRRVGDTVQRSINVRIIAATNRDLPKRIAEDQFREDLYYRLNVFYLHLPPLRERKETVPNLVKLFVHKNNELLGKHIDRISPGAEAVLADYSYPGNVRELENIIEHAVVLAESNEITERDLPDFMLRNRLLLEGPDRHGPPPVTPGSGAILTLKELERGHIERTLDLLDNNYSEAAKKLGVSRSTLWRKIKEFKIEGHAVHEN